MRQPPCVSSEKCERRAVVEQIKSCYPYANNIIEIGCGYGGLARYVARKTDAHVVGVENMPFCVFVARIGNLFCKKSKTVWVDAFEYLNKTDIKFDVAIAYLGPKYTPKLKKYRRKISVLISMDFEIGNEKPVRIIDLTQCGYTIYNGQKYPHKLFVYEF